MTALPKHDAQVNAVRAALLRAHPEFREVFSTVRLPEEDIMRWLRHYQHLPDPAARLLVLWNGWRFGSVRLTFDEYVREQEAKPWP